MKACTVPFPWLKILVPVQLAFWHGNYSHNIIAFSFIRKPLIMNYIPWVSCDQVEWGPKSAASWLTWVLCIWCWELMKSCLCNESARYDAGSKIGLLTFIPRSVDKCDITLQAQAWLLFSVCDFWIGLSSPVSLLSSYNLKNKMEVWIFCLHPLITTSTFFLFIKIRLHSHILIIGITRKAEWKRLYTAHFILMLSVVLLSCGERDEAGVPLSGLFSSSFISLVR